MHLYVMHIHCSYRPLYCYFIFKVQRKVFIDGVGEDGDQGRMGAREGWEPGKTANTCTSRGKETDKTIDFPFLPKSCSQNP